MEYCLRATHFQRYPGHLWWLNLHDSGFHTSPFTDFLKHDDMITWTLPQKQQQPMFGLAWKISTGLSQCRPREKSLRYRADIELPDRRRLWPKSGGTYCWQTQPTAHLPAAQHGLLTHGRSNSCASQFSWPGSINIPAIPLWRLLVFSHVSPISLAHYSLNRWGGSCMEELNFLLTMHH